MTNDTKQLPRMGQRPRIGVVAMAYPGFFLGEELAPAKLRQMLDLLETRDVEVVRAGAVVQSVADARRAGEELRGKVDCILAVLTTFVPDHFVVDLLDACNVPIFLWALEREMRCIALVCGPLITGTLFGLNRPCELVASDLDDAGSMKKLLTFARAAMLVRKLRTLRVGYCGGKCPIMLGMEADQYLLKNSLGVTVVDMPIQELLDSAQAVSNRDAAELWRGLSPGVGEVTASQADVMLSVKYYLAARRLSEQHRLDALSINCFPHLKSKVCLATALLNDAGIAAACEGDLNSTILMALMAALSGRAAFNGDFLRMYKSQRDVLFSHCGAGALTLADGPGKVCLRQSMETHDGLAVCYATDLTGLVTLANMMCAPAGVRRDGPAGLRIAAMAGQAVKTDLEYEGTPLRIHFERDLDGLLEQIVATGAGHHWNGVAGDYMKELALMCRFLTMPFNAMT